VHTRNEVSRQERESAVPSSLLLIRCRVSHITSSLRKIIGFLVRLRTVNFEDDGTEDFEDGTEDFEDCTEDFEDGNH